MISLGAGTWTGVSRRVSSCGAEIQSKHVNLRPVLYSRNTILNRIFWYGFRNHLLDHEILSAATCTSLRTSTTFQLLAWRWRWSWRPRWSWRWRTWFQWWSSPSPSIFERSQNGSSSSDRSTHLFVVQLFDWSRSRRRCGVPVVWRRSEPQY